MKKTAVLLALCVSIMSSSCLGSFNAFNNLKDWNDGATDNRYVNNAIFWGLWIIPAYPLFFLGDLIIFNVIEFWSGSNPIVMLDGEFESQLVHHKGVDYRLEARKNQFDIYVTSGEKAGKSVHMYYTPENKTWFAQNPEGADIKLTSFKDGMHLVYLPDGQTVKIPQDFTRHQGVSLLQSAAYAAHSSSPKEAAVQVTE
ncbi:MAG: DUF3332 domain-containing protein [Bacteroidetes bacterium]|nr:DUF3332 domain-containing protein [Bacteroidota bacterium]